MFILCLTNHSCLFHILLLYAVIGFRVGGWDSLEVTVIRRGGKLLKVIYYKVNLATPASKNSLGT